MAAGVTRAFDFLRAEEQSNPLNVNIIPRIEETGKKIAFS